METKTIAEQFPWAEAGAKAYVYSVSSWGYHSLELVTITRVGKARITLDGGRQFYVPKCGTELKPVGVDRYRSADLIPTDDPRVEETRLLLEKQKIDNAARAAVDNFTRSRSVDNAYKAVGALLEFIKVNEEEDK